MNKYKELSKELEVLKGTEYEKYVYIDIEEENERESEEIKVECSHCLGNSFRVSHNNWELILKCNQCGKVDRHENI